MQAVSLTDGPSRRKVRTRRAMSGDLEQYSKNVQSVADEGRYIFMEEVTPERRESFRKSFRERDSLVLVAEVDEGSGKRRLVGSLTLTRYGDVKKAQHVRVLGMLVIKGYREMGVGTKMINRALRWARKRPGVEKIVLGVFSNNPRALHLYQKFGFEVEGIRRRHYYIDGKQTDEIDMALFLK